MVKKFKKHHGHRSLENSYNKPKQNVHHLTPNGFHSGSKTLKRSLNSSHISLSNDVAQHSHLSSSTEFNNDRTTALMASCTASSTSLSLLPVMEAKQAIINLVRENPSVVVVGETGSGKTTQIPQYILDYVLLEVYGALHGNNSDNSNNIKINSSHKSEKGKTLMVGCTQPRRVAAISVAKYVAEQRGVVLGREVGYSVRFDDKTSEATRLKFMTDGILLKELLSDPMLSKYGAICCDEAHERTLNSDILFGLLKALTRKRKDLKIIIMSATLNAQKFSQFWRNAPIGVIHGRSHAVTVMHTVEPQADYVDAAINTILQIHLEQGPGDILCFLTGQEEIEDARRVLEKRLTMLPTRVPNFLIYPIYASLPYQEQMKVFERCPGGERKVILATNIAETSITIEGIKYVVDSGMVKSKFFNPTANIEYLKEICESKAQAMQRAGRAGRMTAGTCYRLFTENAFQSLEEEATPEIKRCNFNSAVLQMKAMGINDILDFEFMDKPPAAAIIKAQEVLVVLGALDISTLEITLLGRRMADFPIEPQGAKALLVAQRLGVEWDIIAIIALLATENIFITSNHNQESAAKIKSQFSHSSGDQVTLLNVYKAYCRQAERQKFAWCDANNINCRQMQKAEDIMCQLREVLARDGGPQEGERRRRCGLGPPMGAEFEASLSRMMTDIDDRPLDNSGLLRKALCAGYFLQAAYFDPNLHLYRTVFGRLPVHIHPSSVIYSMTKKKPALVIYNTVLETTRKYMKDVAIVRENWLQNASPNFLIKTNK